MKVTIKRSVDHQDIYTSDIVRAKYLNEYKIEIVFADGKKKIVDFSNFLLSKHLNPMFWKYRNKNNFKKFKIMHGNLNWNDHELIFPVEDLYEGKI